MGIALVQDGHVGEGHGLRRLLVEMSRGGYSVPWRGSFDGVDED